MARRYGRATQEAGGRRAARALENHHLRGRAAPGRQGAIVATCVIDKPMNGAIFNAYVEQMLTLSLSSGDIVIMDNLSSHKVKGIAEVIEARKAKLYYLPPYSPDLNPIEQAFAKLKALLRKAA